MSHEYRSKGRSWIKLWVNDWLDGTTRYEMTGAQRAFWVDLITMAGRSRAPGIVCAGLVHGKPSGYPLERYAGVLNDASVDILDTFRLFERAGKIKLTVTRNTEPKLYAVGILSWGKYQSEYMRQRHWRGEVRENGEQKDKAAIAVAKALRNGTLTRPEHCEKCGKPNPRAHHHLGYSDANLLEVEWLCRGCHALLHSLQRKGAGKVTPIATERCGVEVEVEVEGEGEGELCTAENRSTQKISSAAKTAAGYRALRSTVEFETFWEAYPKKFGKQEALKAWLRKNCEGRLGEALASLAAWKATEQWSDPQFIPYPATWLNKGLWRESPHEAPQLIPAEKKAKATNAAIERVRERLHS